MKLGIVVVYLVFEDNERLLDIHLDFICRHTRCDFQIYGAAPRLIPAFKQKLMKHPKVTLVDVPIIDARGSKEVDRRNR